MLARRLGYRNKKDDSLCIVFCLDQGYAPIASCAIHSLLRNNTSGRNIDIFVLHTETSTKYFSTLRDEFRTIKFARITALEFRERDIYTFNSRDHFSHAMYLRLLIPEILHQQRKVLYLDADLIVTTDLSEIFGIRLACDMKGDVNLCAAVRDYVSESARNGRKCLVEDKSMTIKFYYEDVLEIDHQNYFNSGVMLMDLEGMRSIDFSQRAMILAAKKYLYPDQDVANMLLTGRTKFIDRKWNFRPKYDAPQVTKYADLASDKTYASIIHYAGPRKPWLDLQTPLADLFWSYAEKSAFYEDLKALAERPVE